MGMGGQTFNGMNVVAVGIASADYSALAMLLEHHLPEGDS